ncbi:hypothetical protein [Streptomyces sp. NPDC090798]|uniref:hypothetical protein n=1 Tax=Streptomyces sp. NPDC090798 TaxID=3365968 RepID=UPI0037FBB2BE
MTDRSVGPRCGNNPNVQLTPADRKAIDDFKARLALKASAKPYIDNAIWVDGDPLMEVIAITVWERCARDDENTPQLVCDDPRTIAAFAAAVARAHAAVPSAPADRAAVLREVAEICDEAGAVYASKALNDHADGAFTLMERFLRKADEAEYVATPCSVGGCEPGGEPCTTHERLMAHAEGDHELCEPDCGTSPSRMADEAQQPEPTPYPPETSWQIETRWHDGAWRSWALRTDHDEALNEFERAKDRKHAWRLVRFHTTTAVEAEHTEESTQ